MTVASITPTPAIALGQLSYSLEIQTSPALTALASTDPGQVLVLTLPDGSLDRYAVRPAVSASAPANATSPVVAVVTASNCARIITNLVDYIGQPAFLVHGYGVNRILPVPLTVPIAQQTTRAQVTVTGSTQNPFLAGEQIVNPNGILPDRPEPASAPMLFSGPQRLLPAAPPPVPPPATPVDKVSHRYYQLANANGQASQTLPFTTPAVTGVSGYVLQREPVRSLALADVKRRNNLVDSFYRCPV